MDWRAFKYLLQAKKCDGSMREPKIIPIKANRCPICFQFSVLEFRPFCSKRCADLDLGNWLDEAYRIPSNRLLESED